ncbi:MAG TPA: cellulase family glycosylhydrolase [Candidatus Saccharimonadales bacterium]|nr:cellulase family glycosylhydrolase [Candidatus Saccharimonadales bacterium]
MTPSLYENTLAKDEYTYCKRASGKQLSELKNFRDTFITERDFKWLKEHGITSVRLPVGYWVFGDIKPFVGTIDYVDLAFEWAKKYKISVLLDFHGLAGSQNGRDHSGKAGTVSWHKNSANIRQSLTTIDRLSERYSNHSAFIGISLMNEPHPMIPKRIILEFYKNAYEIIRKNCGTNPWVVFSDGYLPLRWKKELALDQFINVYIDTHHYQAHTPIDKILSLRLNLLRARVLLPLKIARLRKYHPVIVGEWSLALGNRRFNKLSDVQREPIARAYCQAQLMAFNKTEAWYFWSYKTETTNLWSFRYCVENHLLITNQGDK